MITRRRGSMGFGHQDSTPWRRNRRPVPAEASNGSCTCVVLIRPSDVGIDCRNHRLSTVPPIAGSWTKTNWVLLRGRTVADPPFCLTCVSHI